MTDAYEAGAVIIIAMVPSVIAWFRMGPRIDSLEKWRDKLDVIIDEQQKLAVRQQTLQETMDKRLDKLEAR